MFQRFANQSKRRERPFTVTWSSVITCNITEKVSQQSACDIRELEIVSVGQRKIGTTATRMKTKKIEVEVCCVDDLDINKLGGRRYQTQETASAKVTGS